jgi:hypothetical protein
MLRAIGCYRARWIGLVVVVAGLCAPATVTRGQPLADRLPSDALLYVGWAGADKLGPAYAQSHLKGVMDASDFPELFSELFPKIARRLQLEQMMQGDPALKEVIPTALALGEAVWHKPTAIYLGPIDLGGKIPMPRLAILIDAGKDAAALSEQITKLIALIPQDVPVRVKVAVWPGDVLVVSNFEMPEKSEETLAQREQFKSAMAQGRPDPAFAMFFDAEKVIAMASTVLNVNPQTGPTWRAVLMSTGVAGIKRVVVTSGFDGKDWGTQAYVEAPQPRMGLLAGLLDPTGVSDDVLKWAPRSSNWVMATRFDFGGLLAGVRGAMARIEPRASKDFEGALGEFTKLTGVDVQKDLLMPLGDQWLAYNSEDTGRGLLGLVLVNPLRDAGKFEQSALKLQAQLNEFLKSEGAQEQVTVSIEQTKIGDTTVHYLAVPAVAPCWAVKNGKLYMALFPQILAAAMEHDGDAGKSVLQNPAFTAARERVGVKQPISISFMDLPKLAPRGYQMLLIGQRSLLGFADMFGLQTPAMVLPPLNEIMPHLSPAASATWIDDNGWHYRGVTPFPGAQLLGGEQALAVTAAPVLAGVALPAMARARQQAVAVQSMSNLRQIGLAVHMYANDHQGDVPPDLGSTYPYLRNTMVYFKPARQQMMMAQPPNLNDMELRKWLVENSDYVYLGREGMKLAGVANTSQYIIGHEKLDRAERGMAGAVFLDGHAEILPVVYLQQRVEEQKKGEKAQ